MEVVSGGCAEGLGVHGTTLVSQWNWATIWSDGSLPSKHSTQHPSAVMCGHMAAAAGCPRERFL